MLLFVESMSSGGNDQEIVGSASWCLARGIVQEFGSGAWCFERLRALEKHEKEQAVKARAERKLRLVKRQYRQALEERTVRACRRLGFDCHWHIPNNNGVREATLLVDNAQADGDWELDQITTAAGCKRFRLTRPKPFSTHILDSLVFGQYQQGQNRWFISQGTAIPDNGTSSYATDGTSAATAIPINEDQVPN